jgi:actin related protein 2/3 complex subunit 5
MAQINWRTIDVDAYDPDSSTNFDLSTLAPSVVPVSGSQVQSTVTQIRQLSRGGDYEGALMGALDTAPYGADEAGKVRATQLPALLLRFTGASLPKGWAPEPWKF